MTSCRIPLNEIRLGDFLVFKGKGLVFQILSRILKFFDRKWDRWGWHTAFVSGQSESGMWLICESLAKGVCVNPLLNYPFEEIRAYRWFETIPKEDDIKSFLSFQIGQPYDVAIYLWTALQYLVRHFINHRIPRLLDDRFTCWENCFEFAEEMGKRIGSKYDCPMLPDMLKAFGEI